MKNVELYIAGISVKQHGISGYGVLIKYESTKKSTLSQSFEQSTSNRMQILACIEGLKALEVACVVKVKLYLSSKYIVDSINNDWVSKWRRNNWRNNEGKIQNVDLWKELLYLLKQHNVEFIWISKHEKNPYLALCSDLAKCAIKDMDKILDTGYHKQETEDYKSEYYEREESICECYGYDNDEEFVIDAAYEGDVEAYLLRHL
jgi:ribonuclease HI